jgi:hypothetical protein
MVGPVYHDRGKAGINTGFGQLEGIAVIQMQGDRDIGAQRFDHLYSAHSHIRQKCRIGIFAGTAGYLQNHRRF